MKTAYISGASRGLGLALARELAQRGYSLLISARGAQALEQARAELAQHAKVIAIAGDVSSEHHRRDLAHATQQLGGIDLVINNASILGPSPQPNLLDYPLETLEQVYRVNTIAPLAVLQALRPQLHHQLRVINISSDAAVEPYAGWGGYGSSKAGLDQLSAILAAENPSWRVYSVDPGDMNTQMHQEAFPGEDISDRPAPEASVPGLLCLIDENLPSGRYQARATASAPRELRFSITVDDLENTYAFYHHTLGLSAQAQWGNDEIGYGALLSAPRATLELIDPQHAAYVDTIETGSAQNRPYRIAIRVDNLEQLPSVVTERAIQPSVQAPWGDRTQRFQAESSHQLTIFQSSEVTE